MAAIRPALSSLQYNKAAANNGRMTLLPHHHHQSGALSTAAVESQHDFQQQQPLDLILLQDGGDIKDDDDDDIDWDELFALARQTPTPLRLSDIIMHDDDDFLLRNAQFLYKELPIRIAQIAVDLLTLPYGLNESPDIRRVAYVYMHYCLRRFRETEFPATQERDFTDMLSSLVLDRTSIPMAIARGVIAFWRNDKQEKVWELEQLQEMEDALYRFFMARVGLRFLTVHHILLSTSNNDDDTTTNEGLERIKQRQQQQMMLNKNNPDSSSMMVGCIQKDCNPVLQAHNAAEQVTRQMLDHYGICPKIDIVDCTTIGKKKKKKTKQQINRRPFTYVPHHLQFMLMELLKNSCRATIMRTQHDDGNAAMSKSSEKQQQSPKNLPPIRVVIVQGEQDVTIKIADKGGGIPRSQMSRIWRFAKITTTTTCDYDHYSTTTTEELHDHNNTGFGLPLARIYARYFGGNLTLRSTEGEGLDAYLYLPRLLEDSCETLPQQRAIVDVSDYNVDHSISSSSETRERTFNSNTTTTDHDQQQQSCNVTTERQALVDDGSGYSIEETWEDVKIRRILSIIKRRAL